MHGGGEIELVEGPGDVAADANVVQILPCFCVRMEEHSTSLPLVRLSLQREL